MSPLGERVCWRVLTAGGGSEPGDGVEQAISARSQVVKSGGSARGGAAWVAICRISHYVPTSPLPILKKFPGVNKKTKFKRFCPPKSVELHMKIAEIQ